MNLLTIYLNPTDLFLTILVLGLLDTPDIGHVPRRGLEWHFGLK